MRRKSARTPRSRGLPPPPPAAQAAASVTVAGSGETAGRTGLAAPADWLVLAIALALAGTHLALRVRPEWRYQLHGPVFFLEAGFVAKFSREPGGLVQYLGAGLASLNYLPLLGTTALTAVWAAIVIAARRLWRTVAPGGGTAGALLLLGVLAALPGRYAGNVEAVTLGILFALLGALGWMHLPGPAALRWTGGVLGGGLVFYLAGPLPTGLFAVTITLVEALVHRRPVWGMGCVLAGIWVPLWWWLRPAFAPLELARPWPPGVSRALLIAAWSGVPLGLVLLAVWPKVRNALSQARRPLTWQPFLPADRVVALMVGAAVTWAALDPVPRALARLDHAVARGQWAEALAAARGLPVWPPPARLALLRALYETGRLPEDLFQFPQTRGTAVLPEGAAAEAAARVLATTLCELGEVNLAEHWAHEALEIEGPRAETLRLLARINVLKDRPEAARIFLRRLGRLPFHQAEAGRALQVLAEDPRGERDAEVARLRARLPTTDLAASSLPADRLLLHLLRDRPTNHMAYAYLLTHRLLSGELEALPADLRQALAHGYSALPRPCAEALAMLGQARPGPPGLAVPPEVVADYERFLKLHQTFTNNPTGARAALAAEFGDTFWFYHRFGHSAPRANLKGLRP